MIPELGHYALIMALCMALVQAVFPLFGSLRGIPGWMAVAPPAAWSQFIFLVLSYAALTHAFLTHDFSVIYVANNSNTALPLIYRLSGVWGAHEGSLLLWALILGGWTVAVASFSRSLPDETVAQVLSVMGIISIGFLLFMLLTSNPFDRQFPAPADGADLNPLLQDLGLAIHPPMLYLGYVGFSVAFAFALAALISGRFDAAWARWSRPWTTLAWAFLTVGITLGSWWAYYELGWGGWWFWDPVENASFMPWLMGTALIHSLAITEKRGTFRSWTVLLAISAFSLSLLGTFLVRSGVLTSVHAFATDPARGVFILTFLGIVIGGSLCLYAGRAPAIRRAGYFSLLSRETLLLGNNVLLTVAAASILLGTLYPLILEALGLGKISVGAPYFNTVFVPLMAPLIFLMGIGPIVRWKKDTLSRLIRRLCYAFLGSVMLAIGLVYALAAHAAIPVLLGVGLAVWILLTTLIHMRERLRGKRGFFSHIRTLPWGYYGMTVAHLGLTVTVVGVTLVSAYSEERDLRMDPGDTVALGGYVFQFEKVSRKQGANYVSDEGLIRVRQGDREVAVLRPEKRIYQVQRQPMTEAAIDPGLTRDLYVALGEPLENAAGSWSVRVHYKPFVRWLWLGGVLMALGGILAVSDKRYRLATRQHLAVRQRLAARQSVAEVQVLAPDVGIGERGVRV
jgi:c-type cytochrome biogenesis protein CcmF